MYESPDRPETIDPDAFGEKQAVLEMDHEEAIEHVREVCEDVGFGIPVEFSPSELLNEKVDADHDPTTCSGLATPKSRTERSTRRCESAASFLQHDRLPGGPGRQRVYHVSIMRIARLLGTAPDNEAWEEIIDTTGDLTEEAFDRFDSVERETRE